MKLLLASLVAAVSAFSSTERKLLTTTPLRERGIGVDPHNDKVSAEDLVSAGQAAAAIYHKLDCESETVTYGDWTCVKGQEIPYPYWFNRVDDQPVEDTFIRFHFFKHNSANKCGFVFRGTEPSQPKEWWTNFNFLTKKPAWWFMNENIHKGYKDAFDGWKEEYWIMDETTGLPQRKIEHVGGVLKGDISYFLDHHKASCVDGVFFVGHSLGGALATTADLWYADNYGIQKKNQGYPEDAVSITFGAPMITQQKPTKRTINEVRIIHKYDPVASAALGVLTRDEWGKNMEHRGPAKIITCQSGQTGYDTCEVIRFEDGDEQAASTSWLNFGYHNMDNYMKYVQAAVEPLKLLGASCARDSQCHSGFCSSTYSCRDADGAVAAVESTVESIYQAMANKCPSWLCGR